jgi:hypothetical protein
MTREYLEERLRALVSRAVSDGMEMEHIMAPFFYVCGHISWLEEAGEEDNSENGAWYNPWPGDHQVNRLLECYRMLVSQATVEGMAIRLVSVTFEKVCSETIARYGESCASARRAGFRPAIDDLDGKPTLQ